MDVFRPRYLNSPLFNSSPRNDTTAQFRPMTPPRNSRQRNAGCIFCPYIGDCATVNQHLNSYVPALVSKLKSVRRLFADDFHHVGIITGARYNKQRAKIRAKITAEEWDMPGLTERIVLVGFGKRAVVKLEGRNELENHCGRARIPKEWWERKVVQAVHFLNMPDRFSINAFIDDVLDEAHGLRYPRYDQLGYSMEREPTPTYAEYINAFRSGEPSVKRDTTPRDIYKYSRKHSQASRGKDAYMDFKTSLSDDDEHKYPINDIADGYNASHYAVEDDDDCFIVTKQYIKKEYESERGQDADNRSLGPVVRVKMERDEMW